MSFLCKWCTSAAADLAGTSRIHYAPNPVNLRVMCSSRVDPQHILYAFKEGADGVFIGGCHPGDCHYVEGNYKTLRRVTLFKRMLDDLGIDPGGCGWNGSPPRKERNTLRSWTNSRSRSGAWVRSS